MTKLKHENIKTITAICRLNDKYLITGHENGLISVFAAKTGEIVNHWGGQYVMKSNKEYNQTAISSLIRVNNKAFAFGGSDGYLRIQKISESGGGYKLRLIPMTGVINHLVLNQAGDIILSTQCRSKEGANQIAIINGQDYTIKKQFITDDKILGNESKLREHFPDALMLLPDQRIVFSTYSADNGGCAIVIWNTENDETIVFPCTQTMRITGLTYDPKSKQLFSLRINGMVETWDLSGKLLTSSPSREYAGKDWHDLYLLESKTYVSAISSQGFSNLTIKDRSRNTFFQTPYVYFTENQEAWIKLGSDCLVNINVDLFNKVRETGERGLYRYAMGEFPYTWMKKGDKGDIDLLMGLLEYRFKEIFSILDQEEIKDIKLNTALHLAAKYDKLDLAKILISVNQKMLVMINEVDKTPYQIAIEKNHQSLIKLFEEQSIIMKEQGNDLYNQHKFKEALIIFDNYLLLKPNSSDALYMKGRILIELNQAEKALSHFKKIIQVESNNFHAYYLYGEVLFSLKKYQECFDACKKSLSLCFEQSSALDLMKKVMQMMLEKKVQILFEKDPKDFLNVKLAEDCVLKMDLKRFLCTPGEGDEQLYHYAMGINKNKQYQGDVVLLSELLKYRPKEKEKLNNPEIYDCDGNTALHLAILSNNANLVKEILSFTFPNYIYNKQVLKTKNNDGKTPLQLAIEINNKNIICLFNSSWLKNTFHLNEQKKIMDYLISEITPKQLLMNEELLQACQDGHLKKIKAALELGAHLETKDKHGKTPLWLCFEGIKNGHTQCAEYLLEKKQANVEEILPFMAKQGYIPIVRYILSHMDKSLTHIELLQSTWIIIDLIGNKNSNKVYGDIKELLINTLLFEASSCGNLDLVNFALLNGANLNMQDYYLNRPIHAACEKGHEQIVAYLLNQNCDIKVYNCQGNLPYEIAKNGVIKQLIDEHIIHKGNIIQAEVKGFLERCRYKKIQKKEHELLKHESKQLINQYTEQENFKKVSQISSALEKFNFHALRQIKRGKVEEEVPVKTKFKVTY